MAKYRKKPFIVEAIEWQGDIESEEEISAFIGKEVVVNDLNTTLLIEDTMVAHVGDYIVKDAIGKIYACRADVFDLTYDAV